MVCWEFVPEKLKGEIARILQACSKCAELADRLIVQEGALRALSNLLDSEDEDCASLAAGALANMSYWSHEGVRRLSRFQVYCAV